MAPEHGLVHQKEYDWRDSNVEFIGSDMDHKVKYNSAATEPAWRDVAPSSDDPNDEPDKLRVWRIEDFEVVPWPQDRYGDFHEGDSYIVLHSFGVGSGENRKLVHDIFFWLGSQTTQDEAGTAAYKTVELDELLKGAATQHRELQREPSDDFVALFPRIRILRGGVRSGFRHVEEGEGDEEAGEEKLMLLRIFKHPSSKSGPGRSRDSIMVVEVEPSWSSLDEGDVFVLEKMGGGNKKIWVWQGRNCSPMEKAKAAQVVHDMTLAKHVDVEVLSQTESRSRTIVAMLGAEGDDAMGPFRAARPVLSSRGAPGVQDESGRPRRLFRLSDASGRLTFSLVKEGTGMGWSDLDGNDVFLLDTGGQIWVWQGAGASRGERATWIRVAESYLRDLLEGDESSSAYLSPISKVVEGSESPAFVKALEV